MKKFSLAVQWLVVAALVALVGYTVWRPVPQPEYRPETWRNWDGFMAISYAGVARQNEPDYPSAERLAEHLQALRAAGYHTVRPADVQAFLAGRAPLPDRALLLLFEGGRKEAFIRATPLLQQNGFQATLLIPTAYMHRWGTFFLKKNDVRRVGRLPQWSIGSMGHEAYDAVPVSAQGAPGRFLTRRRWKGDRLEEASEYRERVLDDYAKSARLLREALGRPAPLYLYPFADAGRLPGADPLAESVNRLGLESHFALGFAGAGDPFNGPLQDPLALTRLRVRGEWGAEQLIAELERSRPRPRARPGWGSSDEWLLERDVVLRAGGLDMPAGAAAWLRGTENWADVEVAAELERSADAVATLYVRYANARSWLRVALDADGLRIQERLGHRLQTLFRHVVTTNPDSKARIRLRVRNNRAWVWWNDELVGGELPVSLATRRGRIGLGGENSPVRFASFEARRLPARLALANSLRLVPEERQADLRAVLPVWFRAGEPPDLAETRRQDLLRAAAAGIETIPVIVGVGALDEAGAVALVDDLDEALDQAAFKPLVRTLGVEGDAETLAAALREKGYRVAHLLKPDEALGRARSLAQWHSEDVVILAEASVAARGVLDELQHWIPSSRLAVEEEPSEDYGAGVRTAVFADQHPGKEASQ